MNEITTEQVSTEDSIFGTTYFFKVLVNNVVVQETIDGVLTDKIFGVEVQGGSTLEYQMSHFITKYAASL